MAGRVIKGILNFLSLPLVRYVRKRFFIGIVVLIGISIISFSTVYLLPGDPVTSRFPEMSRQEKKMIRVAMGLDQPLPVQYWKYMGSVFKGDFGFSYNTGKPVIEDLKARAPATLELSAFALWIALVIGVPLGIIAAVKRNHFLDHLARLVTIGTLSIPAFWVGVLFIYIFFYLLHWAPAPMGRLSLNVVAPPTVTGFLTIDSLLARNGQALVGALRAIALPAIVLGLSIVAPISRITRSAMSEALQEDYIRFARAVGVPEREVILRDAFRGSLVAVLTITGYIVGYLMGGAALVETVFAWPGLGRYAIEAIVTSDMAPINTVLLFVAFGVAMTNMLVDLGYAVVDPRIREGFAGQGGGDTGAP